MLPEVPRASIDDHWLPIVGEQKLIVITRDQRIRYRAAEKRAWVEHGVRGFVLTGRRSQTTSASRVILERHWGRLLAIINAQPVGPWMVAVTGSDLRPIDVSAE